MTEGNEKKTLLDFKGMDFTSLSLEDRIAFSVAQGVSETGMQPDELIAMNDALSMLEPNPTILELGQCTGTSTRFLLTYVLSHSGTLHSIEQNLRRDFFDAMVDLGLWDKFTTYVNNTQTIHWQGGIDFLLIDTEHTIADALGEYCRFRGFLNKHAIIGFHDAWEIPGVRRAIEIVQEIDEIKEIARSPRGVGFGIRLFKLMEKNKGCYHQRPESIEEM